MPTRPYVKKNAAFWATRGKKAPLPEQASAGKKTGLVIRGAKNSRVVIPGGRSVITFQDCSGLEIVIK